MLEVSAGSPGSATASQAVPASTLRGVTATSPPPCPRPADDAAPGGDGPRDACGVFAVYAPTEHAAKLAYYGLYALQHRGQESAGIAVSDGTSIFVTKEMGLVNQVFDET